MLSVKKTDRDLCLQDLIPIVAPLGLQFRRVTGRYMLKGGAPLNLFRNTEPGKCKLLISVRLTDLKGRLCRHFVAFDGSVIYDKPLCAKVNRSWDRATKKSCDNVFLKLFPREEFLSWQIVRVFELVTTDI